MQRRTVKKHTDLAAFLVGLGYSRTKTKQLVRHRAVEVNGTAAQRPDHPLSPGDRVEIGRKTGQPEVPPPRGITILHDDGAILVAAKPAGLLSIATEHERKRTAYYLINEYLRRRDPRAQERVFIVHRLDRDTSGLIVFAKSEGIKRRLQGGWKKAEKRYCAVVEGIPKKREGEIRSHLAQTDTFKVYSARPSEKSRLAVTRYRVLAAGRGRALLDVTLETGRKNQIRVHLSDIDHPVVGDRKYGAETDPLGRLALHAYLLAFPHPLTGEPLRFRTEVPRQFRELVRDGRGTGSGPRGRGGSRGSRSSSHSG